MRYRFGDFEADSRRFVLLRGGRPLRIEPKPLRLLLLLLEHHPDAVAKHELLDALWPDTAVTEGSLIRAVREVRRTLRESAQDGGVIRTARGRGYAIGVEVERLEEAPDAASAAPSPATDFVGRGPALAALGAALAQALAGRGRIVLVRGEAGIGKSRLLAEFGALARAGGVPVAATWCPEDESEPAFWPWRQLLRQLVRAGRLNEASLDDAAPIFAVPEEGDAARDRANGREARYRLFEAVAGLVGDATREAGALLVIDDLHGADDDTLRLLEFAARDLATARVLLVLGERDPGGAKPEALARVLAQLARLPHFEELRLAGLEAAHVGELAERLGSAADTDTVSDIATRTAGNPFYARELLRAATASATSNVRPGAARETGPLPTSVRDVLRERLARLSSACNRALAAGSVVGCDFAPAVVARAIAAAPGEVAAALVEAVEEGLVRVVGHTYRFDHAIVREVIQAEQAPARIVELHHRVADALEADPAGAQPAEVALHLSEAGDAIDPPRIVEYAHEAGRRAVRMLAFEGACAHFDRALAALARQAAPDPGVHAELLISRGHARLAAGHVMAGVRADFVEAASVARGAADTERLTGAALGFQTIPSNFPLTDPVVGPLVEEAVALVGHREDEVAVRLTCRLATELYYTERRAEAEVLADRAEALAAKLGRPDLQAFAIQAKLFVSMGSEPPPVRLEWARKAIALAAKAGHAELEAYARGKTFQMLLEIGDSGAASELEPLEALVSRHPLPRERINLLRYRAALCFLAGDLDAAQPLFAEAFETSRRMGAAAMLVLSAAGVSLCMRERGQSAMVLAMFGSAVTQLPENPVYRSALANAYALAGREEEAAREFAALTADGVGTIPRDANYLPMLVSLAEVSRALGDVERAREIGTALEPHAEWFVVGGEVSVCMGSVARYVAMMKEVAGESDADAWYDRAIEANTRAGALHWARRA